MPSYQIPQFLDSGDKIFLGMNVRQFAYALVGFFVCVLIFNIFFPAIGNYSFVIVAPIGLFTLYLSLGKYNGRDSEVYILKYIIFNVKPRFQKYARAYDLSNEDFKLSQLNYEVVNRELENRLVSSKAQALDPLTEFRNQNAQGKAGKIRQLGKSLDDQMVNVSNAVISQEVKIERHRELLKELDGAIIKR
jgi:PrgI family protein